MIQGARLAAMLPHAGAMILLDAVVTWDATTIRTRSHSHFDPANPLRRNGRLSAVIAVEYGLQAAALHGAMLAGGTPQRAGYVARLRDVVCHVPFLDEPEFGVLGIEAQLERQEANGTLYALAIHDNQSRPLVTARATIALPPQ